MSSIPMIASASDLPNAVRYAQRNPGSRWYVARRAAALGASNTIPPGWSETSVADAVVAAFGGDWSPPPRDEAEDKGEALPGGKFPIKDVEDLKRAIKAFGRAKDKNKAKKHIIKRARALDAVSELPESWGITAAGLTAAKKPHVPDLPSGIGWDEALHPRGKKGWFITKNGSIQVVGPLGSDPLRATAIGARQGPDGKTYITGRFEDGQSIPSYDLGRSKYGITINPDETFEVEAYKVEPGPEHKAELSESSDLETDIELGPEPTPEPEAPEAPAAPSPSDPTAAPKVRLMAASAVNKGIMDKGTADARIEAILGNPDRVAAHKDMAKLMTELKLGGKQRARYRELLDAHHGGSEDSDSAVVEAKEVSANLSPDNPVKDKLDAKIAELEAPLTPEPETPNASGMSDDELAAAIDAKRKHADSAAKDAAMAKGGTVATDYDQKFKKDYAEKLRAEWSALIKERDSRRDAKLKDLPPSGTPWQFNGSEVYIYPDGTVKYNEGGVFKNLPKGNADWIKNDYLSKQGTPESSTPEPAGLEITSTPDGAYWVGGEGPFFELKSAQKRQTELKSKADLDAAVAQAVANAPAPAPVAGPVTKVSGLTHAQTNSLANVYYGRSAEELGFDPSTLGKSTMSVTDLDRAIEQLKTDYADTSMWAKMAHSSGMSYTPATKPGEGQFTAGDRMAINNVRRRLERMRDAQGGGSATPEAPDEPAAPAAPAPKPTAPAKPKGKLLQNGHRVGLGSEVVAGRRIFDVTDPGGNRVGGITKVDYTRPLPGIGGSPGSVKVMGWAPIISEAERSQILDRYPPEQRAAIAKSLDDWGALSRQSPSKTQEAAADRLLSMRQAYQGPKAAPTPTPTPTPAAPKKPKGKLVGGPYPGGDHFVQDNGKTDYKGEKILDVADPDGNAVGSMEKVDFLTDVVSPKTGLKIGSRPIRGWNARLSKEQVDELVTGLTPEQQYKIRTWVRDANSSGSRAPRKTQADAVESMLKFRENVRKRVAEMKAQNAPEAPAGGPPPAAPAPKA